MAGKRKERDDKAGSAIREDLGFDSERAYRRWKKGPRFKPYRDAFKAGFLKFDAFEPGKEYEDFEEVFQSIRGGEAYGKRRFSDRGAENKFTTSLDWYCWIVFNIAHENTITFDGCFFRKSLDEYETHRRIWNTIQNEIQSRSSALESFGKRRKQNSGWDFLAEGEEEPADLFSDSPDDDEDESESDDDLDPSAGIAEVYWTNMPDDAYFSRRRSVRISGFCGLSETEFKTQVHKALGFEENLEQIQKITSRTNLSFRGAKWEAFHGFIVDYDVETECACP
jgi:hypothetical protein